MAPTSFPRAPLRASIRGPPSRATRSCYMGSALGRSSQTYRRAHSFSRRIRWSRQSAPPLWRLPSLNGFNALMLEETRVYRSFFSSSPDAREYNLDLNKLDSPLLDLAGIRYI